MSAKNFANLCFGDLRPDGSIDVNILSNNGDIIKVLATVVNILKHYTAQNPETAIFFAGSTVERTKLYGRILKTYYTVFSEEFTIGAIIEDEDDNKVLLFDPAYTYKYLGFFIKRI